MKKVLIIGFLWPYISGSKRVIGLASHLPEFGWKPLILTAPLSKEPPSHFNVIQTNYYGLLGAAVKTFGLNEKQPLGGQLKEQIRGLSPFVEKFLRKGFDLFREVYAYPDEHKRWKKFAISSAEKAIKNHDIEAMISVWPVTGHLVARNLKNKYGIPWIADLADLWSDNSAYPYGNIRHWFDERLEKQTFSDADVLTTSSEPLAERLSLIHGGRKVSSIMMGFDPNIVNNLPAILRKRFTITYTGVFYENKRDPYPFFKALQQLIMEKQVDPSEIEVRIFGPDKSWVRCEIDECNLLEVVKHYPSVSFEKCLERQKESHVLLQINWNDKNEKGVFSGKFLDYLAAGRPILAAGGSGNDEVVIKILKQTNAGVYAVTIKDIKKFIKEFYDEYQSSETVKYTGNWEQVDKYSNRAMACQFAKHLDEIKKKET